MKIKYTASSDVRVAEFNDYITKKYPQFLDETNPDLILVAGGDGAMLHSIQENIDLKVPFFGKARGTFNFLMNVFENNKKVIEGIVSDEHELYVVETGAISVSIDGQPIGEAVNEVLIGDSINGYYEFTLSSEDESFDNFKIKGAGICVSTPLGSTGYNFNNGGPILPVGRKLWAITGVVCNQLVNDLLNIQTLSIAVKKSTIMLDGIEKATVHSESKLVLSPGKLVKLAFLNKKQFLHQRVELSHRLRK